MTDICSTKPLIAKLGITPKQSVLFLHAPKDYQDKLGDLPAGIKLHKSIRPHLDFIQFFVKSTAELHTYFPLLKESLKQQGCLWISWPKQKAKMLTDLNENIVREIGLEYGLVDVKVCSVDEIWSGLKFVFRLRDRK
jgi:hypothetical protein